MVVVRMNELRGLRRAVGLGQREFAQQLSVGLETFRTWDSGRRAIPVSVMQRARQLVADLGQQNELLPLDQLASSLNVHVRTLQAAARTGRLEAHFTVRSVFGRPLRLATRAAGARFLATYYRRFSGQRKCPPPLPVVPDDYHEQLTSLRRRLRLTQAGLALRIGAAGKAVVYQWEARKRTPSPVLWQRVILLQPNSGDALSENASPQLSKPRPLLLRVSARVVGRVGASPVGFWERAAKDQTFNPETKSRKGKGG